MEFKDKLIEYFNQLIYLNINLMDYAKRNQISIYVNGNLNKGWKGNVIEHMLNIPVNNKKGSDYIDLEIKTVPIIRSNNRIIVKETTCLSTIDLNSIINTTFEDSDLLKKINKTLFILIDVSDNDFPKIDSTCYVNFNLHNKLLNEMKNDYNNLINHILDNISYDNTPDNNFSGRLGKVIQPRPKLGKKGEYHWAFYLKKKVLESFINSDIEKHKSYIRVSL